MGEESSLSDEIEFVHEYEIKQSKKEVHPASVEAIIIVSKVKEAVKELIELLMPLKATGAIDNRYWQGIIKIFGEKLT